MTFSSNGDKMCMHSVERLKQKRRECHDA